MAYSRKGFLKGIGCAAAGAAVGAVGHRQLTQQSQPLATSTGSFLKHTYAQCGEDQIVNFILEYLEIRQPDYLDVGAWAPVHNNNTYLFYTLGCRGVLVEPNVDACEKLREVRPRDTVIEAGIGVTSVREADYYVMTKSSWNTFSKEEAERQEKVSNGSERIKKVIKMPLLDINQVIADHFKRAPAFLSLDTQGLELAILKTIDYGRFRPKVICAETLVTGTNKMVPEIAAFMDAQGYVVRGMSFVNTIFVDSKIV